MANERITENIVRNKLRQLGYYDDENIVIEEQQSKNPRIQKQLKTASKSGTGGGYPEFIISFIDSNDLMIIIECKADTKKHESKERENYKDYAVDGVLLYASYLSKEFDVLAIAVSGQSEKELKISHFLQLKNSSPKTIFSSSLLSYKDYKQGITQDEAKLNQEYESIIDYTKTLNQLLHNKKIQEDKRSLLISSILICLENQSFEKSYREKRNASELANLLVNTIAEELNNTNIIPPAKLTTLKQSYSFIKTDKTLSSDKEFVLTLIKDVDKNIKQFVKTYKYYDIFGEFYVEFLRYANNDKGLGIVLTPKHTTEFFCDLVKLNKDSVVYDNCCGTGGFLITAMRFMIKKAKGNQEKEKNIKEKQIIGIEYQGEIFPLACSNMIIHGDGQTNIFNEDCFKIPHEKKKEIKNHKINVGFLNPPYKTDKNDIEEFKFVLNNLEMLERGGKCVAILPMRCALYQKGEGLELKKKLIEEHTLEAVFSMPHDLFHNSKVGVVTCVMLFNAHQPHPERYETFFGYFKDDGFVKKKNRGRIDGGTWKEKKRQMLDLYQNKKNVAGLSVTQCVHAEDEWCAEAYMETDYSMLKEENFIKTIREYSAFLVGNDR